MKTRVAIQGIKGSFHHQAAMEYFSQDISIDECLSFRELIKSLLENRSDQAIMALENSIAGSIIPNYALIDTNNLHIIGEHYLTISQNLMVLKGQTIYDIKEVHSHPMALLQCTDFFSRYPCIKLVEDVDTAETARRIEQGQLQGIGAIASKTASEMYHLDIIAPDIQTVKNNETRFVVIKTKNSVLPDNEINKASIKFELEDKHGSLATVLNIVSDCFLNMTKIQSLPQIETPWKYAFFVDVTFDNYQHYKKAKTVLEIMTQNFKILGEYKNARL